MVHCRDQSVLKVGGRSVFAQDQRELKLPGTKRAASPRASVASLSRGIGAGGAHIVILADAQSSRHEQIVPPVPSRRDSP